MAGKLSLIDTNGYKFSIVPAPGGSDRSYTESDILGGGYVSSNPASKMIKGTIALNANTLDITDAEIVFSEGYDFLGAVNTIETFLGTTNINVAVTNSSLNYYKRTKDTSWETTVNKPVFGKTSATSDYYLDGIWYNNLDVAYVSPLTYLDGAVDVDVSGNFLTYKAVELIVPDILANTIKSDNFRGKNSCTAWVNFDGTATPPTIRDSFNVLDVVRTATGVYDIYFAEAMDNANFSATGIMSSKSTASSSGIGLSGTPTLNTVSLRTLNNGIATNETDVHINIFGGKD